MARAKSFSKKEAIRFGWNTTKKNLVFLAGVTVVMGLVQFAPNLLEPYVEDKSLPLALIELASSIAYVGLTLGAIKIYLAFVDGKKPQFSDLFSLFKIRMIFRFFLASLIYGLAVFGGFFLLVIPGVYVATKYVFYANFIVDKNLGVFESLSKSGEITRGKIWEIFIFQLILLLIALAGLLVFGVGLLVAVPVMGLADVYVYRKLSSKASK